METTYHNRTVAWKDCLAVASKTTWEADMDPYVIVRSLPNEHFAQSIKAGKHRLVADKELSFGGSDLGPGPYGFLLAALGA